MLCTYLRLHLFILLIPVALFSGDDINQSSMVGVINWSEPSAEKTMKAFINNVQEGYIEYTTLPSVYEQEITKKNATQYYLYIYNQQEYPQYNTKENKHSYNLLRQYEKYETMQQLAHQCASIIEEDLEYAYKYDPENLLGATGVKIAEIAEQIFSTPYSTVLNKVSMNFSDNMIKSSADLAIAQQAAFYSKQMGSLSYKKIYDEILMGFNSAEISFREGPKILDH